MKKRFAKVYLEITNICNLRCDFCPGNTRPPHSVTPEEFSSLARALRPYTDYLYFHVMGEPLLHPQLPALFDIAQEHGYHVAITTNGTRLSERHDLLVRYAAAPLYKLSISLHAYEANGKMLLDEHFEPAVRLARELCDRGTIVALRLWNLDGQSREAAHHEHNDAILQALHQAFPEEWIEHHNGYKLRDRLYLEWGERFDWPSLTCAPDYGERGSCYGLRDQIGVLCDGSVIPCCLDGEGVITLGNLHRQSMEEILENPRTRAMIDGFSQNRLTEALCRHCGYARRFVKETKNQHKGAKT